MRCVNSPRTGPRLVLAVASAAEAREGLERCAADAVFLRTPPDGEALALLPPGPALYVPYEPALLDCYRRAPFRMTVHLQVCGLENPVETLLRISRSGLPASLQDLDTTAPATAAELLRRFLHDRGITCAVEPFAALLRALVRKDRFSLWGLLSPEPAVRVFVTPSGRAFATLGDLRRGRSLGTVDDGPAQWRDSAVGRELDAFLYGLPEARPDCLACRFFCYCQGYAAWAGSCAVWRPLLDALNRAARELCSTSRARRDGRGRRCALPRSPEVHQHAGDDRNDPDEGDRVGHAADAHERDQA